MAQRIDQVRFRWTAERLLIDMVNRANIFR
jgi:hypothetical protein